MFQRVKGRLARLRAWAAKRPKLTGGALTLGALGLIAAFVVLAGLAPTKASEGHWDITAWVLHFALRRSVSTHTIGMEAPPLEDRRLVLMGAGHFHGGCRPCHGSPGEPQPRVPMGMTPRPPRLPDRIHQYDDAELFYIVRHGVKFTGMPAWPTLEREDEVWAMVAFLRRLPELDETAYERLVFPGRSKGDESAPAVVRTRCARCHGVDGLGRGEGAFPRLAGQRPAYLRRSLTAYAEGARHSGIMEPIAAALDESDAEESVRWYAAQRPGLGGAPPPDRIGERIATRGIEERRIPACVECHGPLERPRHPPYPKLAGQYAEYIEQQLHLFREKKRGGTEYAKVMQAVAVHALEPAEVVAVSQWYAAAPHTLPEASTSTGGGGKQRE